MMEEAQQHPLHSVPRAPDPSAERRKSRAVSDHTQVGSEENTGTHGRKTRCNLPCSYTGGKRCRWRLLGSLMERTRQESGWVGANGHQHLRSGPGVRRTSSISVLILRRGTCRKRVSALLQCSQHKTPSSNGMANERIPVAQSVPILTRCRPLTGPDAVSPHCCERLGPAPLSKVAGWGLEA